MVCVSLRQFLKLSDTDSWQKIGTENLGIILTLLEQPFGQLLTTEVHVFLTLYCVWETTTPFWIRLGDKTF